MNCFIIKIYICKIFESINDINIILDIHTISIEYINNKGEKEQRIQKIFIISHENMIKYLDYNNCILYGLDCTDQIIPSSFKPLKMMSLYGIDPKTNQSIIFSLILLKYTDSSSLIKLFLLLNMLYWFWPKIINVDFDMSQINSLKASEVFKNKPYLICCLFHF